MKEGRMFTIPDEMTLQRITPYLKLAETGTMNSDIITYFGNNVLERYFSLQEYGEYLLDIVSARYMSTLSASDADILIKSETQHLEKWGPLSAMLPWIDRADDLKDYYRATNPMTAEKIKLMNAVCRELFLDGKHRLNPIALENCVEEMEPSTNSGLPYFTKRKLSQAEDLSAAKEILKNLNREGSYGAPPAIVFWRGQPGGSIPKQRIVWGISQQINLVETKYYLPLYNYLRGRQMPIFAAWEGLRSVDNAITRAFADNDSGVFLSSDYSGYDQSLGSLWFWVVQLLTFAYPSGYHRVLNNLVDMLSRIPMVTPSDLKGTLYNYEVHGMPSGIMFTNLLDSVLNYAAMQFMRTRLKGNLSTIGIQGDDGVCHLQYPADAEIMTDTASELGLEMNPTKQYIHKNAILYLRRYHLRNFKPDGVNVGIASFLRTFGSIVRQERFHKDWNERLAALRTIMILENLYGSPALELAVSEVRRFDPMLSDRNFLVSLLGVRNEARNISGFISTYNAPKLDGMKSWISYKLLLEHSE